MTDFEKKYRFSIRVDHDREYHVFETRYYAQKYINEILMKEYEFGAIYEIRKADDGFVIYKKHIRVI